MKILGGVICLWLFCCSAQAQESAWGNCLTSDLWIVTDYSGSIQGHEDDVFDAVVSIVDGVMNDNGRARVGVVTYSTWANVIQIPTFEKSTLLNEIEKQRRIKANYGTMAYRVLPVIDQMQDQMEPSPFAKDNDFRKIMILITDGEDFDQQRTLKIINEMKEKNGWWVFALFVHKQDRTQEQIEQNWFFLEKASGNADQGQTYVDEAALHELPEYFREHFTCF